MGLFVAQETHLAQEKADRPDVARFYRSSYIPCPKCNQPLRKVAANAGSFFLTCENRIEAPGQKFPGRCGQTVHIVAVEGIAAVAPVSKDQFKKWLRTYPIAVDVYAELGIVVTRPEDPREIPLHKCSSCQTDHPLFDMFGGQCRRCAGMEKKEA